MLKQSHTVSSVSIVPSSVMPYAVHMTRTSGFMARATRRQLWHTCNVGGQAKRNSHQGFSVQPYVHDHGRAVPPPIEPAKSCSACIKERRTRAPRTGSRG